LTSKIRASSKKSSILKQAWVFPDGIPQSTWTFLFGRVLLPKSGKEKRKKKGNKILKGFYMPFVGSV
jgi:hypothetical protein